jgi:hypothetical protein
MGDGEEQVKYGDVLEENAIRHEHAVLTFPTPLPASRRIKRRPLTLLLFLHTNLSSTQLYPLEERYIKTRTIYHDSIFRLDIFRLARHPISFPVVLYRSSACVQSTISSFFRVVLNLSRVMT